ncbi:hypothetical protein [Actinomadura algeriensis]|uniref:Mce-associated membrane protein n=1 Tax=Actinomadura algeriensis TaxID=1679523 RepID=A0ABR9JMJ4_9ACTN|nr:hypothetical protein [Actinomadura algeriensis]MBE1531784.1 Mce-associated membrane protein [Actinomadura algeriensis]
MRRLLRLYRPFAVALGIVLLGVALHPIAGAVRGDERAEVDDVAAAEVTGAVSRGLASVFSYRAGDVAATERAAAQVLRGAAMEQYRTLFGQVKQQAPEQRVTLVTRVVRAGVVSLTGDRASVLVFLDQTATRAGEPAGTPAAAQLVVSARRDQGRWTIHELRAV